MGQEGGSGTPLLPPKPPILGFSREAWGPPEKFLGGLTTHQSSVVEVKKTHPNNRLYRK